MKVYVVAVVLLLTCCMLVPPLFAQCVIKDDEEYAVLAAVLFPNEPDVPDRITNDLEREAYRARARPRMSGFESSSYTIRNETVREARPSPSSSVIERDYYEKNREACSIDAARLRARVPKQGHVSVVSREEEEREAPAGIGLGEADRGFNGRRYLSITYLSRPGFNKDRTEAVVEVHRQSHPEMGVGYRVYLKKSPGTGKWFITNARRTRIS